MSSDNQRHLRSDKKHYHRFDKLKNERRKRNKVKRFNVEFKQKRTELYDSKGVHMSSGQDLCDCLDPECSGCYFKCPIKKCKSNKCGPDCRQKRKYYYESIEDPITNTKTLNQIGLKYETSSQESVIHIN